MMNERHQPAIVPENDVFVVPETTATPKHIEAIYNEAAGLTAIFGEDIATAAERHIRPGWELELPNLALAPIEPEMEALGTISSITLRYVDYTKYPLQHVTGTLDVVYHFADPTIDDSYRYELLFEQHIQAYLPVFAQRIAEETTTVPAKPFLPPADILAIDASLRVLEVWQLHAVLEDYCTQRGLAAPQAAE